MRCIFLSGTFQVIFFVPGVLESHNALLLGSRWALHIWKLMSFRAWKTFCIISLIICSHHFLFSFWMFLFDNVWLGLLYFYSFSYWQSKCKLHKDREFFLVFVVVDDDIIYSKSLEQYMTHSKHSSNFDEWKLSFYSSFSDFLNFIFKPSYWNFAIIF